MLPPRLFQENTSTCIGSSHTTSNPSGNAPSCRPQSIQRAAASRGDCGLQPSSRAQSQLHSASGGLLLHSALASLSARTGSVMEPNPFSACILSTVESVTSWPAPLRAAGGLAPRMPQVPSSDPSDSHRPWSRWGHSGDLLMETSEVRDNSTRHLQHDTTRSGVGRRDGPPPSFITPYSPHRELDTQLRKHLPPLPIRIPHTSTHMHSLSN